MDENVAPERHPEVKEAPEISELASLGTIFFEPERTFKDFKRKPRFVVAGIIIALLVMAYTLGVNYKVGEAGMRSFIAEQIDKSPQAGSLSPEQKSDAIELQMTISKYTRYAVPIFVFISFVIGGLIYWLASKAFGGNGTFLENLAVWVYSGLPPAILSMIANFAVLAFKSVDEIDLAASQRGLLNANLGFFIDGKAHPMIATVLSTFDFFAIWGWILAVIGLTAVNKLSKASSWTIVLLLVLVGLGFRLVGAAFSGNPS